MYSGSNPDLPTKLQPTKTTLNNRVMEAKELRIGNYYDHNGEFRKVTPSVIEEVFEAKRIWCKPIPLSEEILLKCGAVLNTKSKIMKCYWLHLKRDLYLNFSDIGTPNFIVSIICFDEGIITDINIIHNWDYEKEMYLHTLQNIFQSLTNQELEINL